MAIGNANELDLDIIEDGVDEEDENDEDENDVSDSEDEEDEEEDGEDEHDDDSDDDSSDESDEDSDDEEKPTKDKKESKIVDLKRQVKLANKRIAELEEKKEQDLLNARMTDKRDELLDDGVSEEKADELIAILKENSILKQSQERVIWQELSVKYPNIMAFKDKIETVRKSLPDAKIEDIYLTKFSKESAYDTKTRIQQEMQYKQEQAKLKAKGSVGGNSGGADKIVTKLSSSSEDAYKILLKSNPTMTRKQFKELEDLEELT